LINALAIEELRNNLIPLLGAFIETPHIISENYFVFIKRYNDLETKCDLNEISDSTYHDCVEYFKALENAKVAHRGSPHVDIQDFLEAIDKTSPLNMMSMKSIAV
jgi:hypothetical protein